MTQACVQSPHFLPQFLEKAIKTYVKAEIKIFWSSPIFLDFLILPNLLIPIVDEGSYPVKEK